ncbi:MAG: glycosyltransferase family 2 protein, partial [Rickettsiales bacterium]|nr:glycosyltransferase family 2 protein [Rickettsiales bacterium]
MGLKISTIVPVYDDEMHIARCLEHIIRQTYQNLEVIIIDDGSTDNTASVCAEYAKMDKRIKIAWQQNSGPANARSSGLGQAAGDYIHFHDSDDYIGLDYYEKMAHAASVTHSDILCDGVEEIGIYFPRFSR